MTPEIQIRLAVKDDAQLLADLNLPVQALHAEHYPALFKAETALREVAHMFASVMRDASHCVYLAHHGDVPAGYLWHQISNIDETPIKHAHTRLTIHQICVQPTQRRMGVGKAMMQKTLSDAKNKKVDLIWLNTWIFNTTAHRFFESFGFEIMSINMHQFRLASQQGDPADGLTAATYL